MLGIGVLILFLSIVGITYGYWMQRETQNTFDELGVKCFELTMSNETKGIYLEEASPVTEEEGKKQEGYQFTIKNTCNTSATYQVNLEEKNLGNIKRLDNQYIKVSLNDSKGKNLNTYESTETTIKENDFQADDSHILTSGSLGPNEEETYTLKLWMDYDTPAIDAVMNATFESKISVVATYIEDEKLKNDIIIAYEEPNEYSNISETITFRVSSETENVNIIEYSLDGETYETIELIEGKPSSKVNVSLTFTEEKEYTIYFRDSLGNIKEEIFTSNKLDKTPPSIEVNETNRHEGSLLTIQLSDAKSGLQEYKIEGETDWISLNGNNQEITYESTTNKKIKITVKDKVGNEKEQEIEIKGDLEGPSIEVANPKNNIWTNANVTITIQATDYLNEIDKIMYSTDQEQWTELDVSKEEKTGIAILELAEDQEQTYYFKATDIYGNESESSTIVKIDMHGPDIKSFITNDTWGQTNTVVGKVEDTLSGIKGYEISTNEEPSNNWTDVKDAPKTEQTFTQEVRENKTYYLHVLDEAGNTSTKEVEVSKVDTEEPNATFAISESNKGDNDWYKSLKIQVTAIDNQSEVASVKYCVETSDCEPKEEAILSEGTTSRTFDVTFDSHANTQKVCVTVTDEVGNTTTTCDTDTYLVDTNDPSITDFTNTTTSWATSNTLSATVQDLHSGLVAYAFTTSDTPPTNASDWTTVPVTTSVQTYTKPVTSNTTYYFHAKDKSGRIKTSNGVVVDKVDLSEPTFTSFEIQNVNATGYDVYVYGVNDEGSGVNRVQFPSWTTNKEKDDLIENWETDASLTGTKDGTTWRFHVDMEKHNHETGEYQTEVYIYDNVGNRKSVGSKTATVPGVTITYEYNDPRNYSDAKNSITLNGFSGTINYCLPLYRFYLNGLSANDVVKLSMDIEYSNLTVDTSQSYSIRPQGPGNVTGWDTGFGWSGFQLTGSGNYHYESNATLSAQQLTNAYTDLNLRTDYYKTGSMIIKNFKIERVTTKKETKAYHTSLAPLPIVSESGYHFKGWFLSTSGGSALTTSSLVPAENTTYHGQWEDIDKPIQTFNVSSQTTGEHDWYTALTVGVTSNDFGSGVASAKYCFTTSSTAVCAPTQPVTFGKNTSFTVPFASNASAQRVCVQTTDVSGKTSDITCSPMYKVDTSVPIANLSASSTESNIIIQDKESSDAESGISKREYRLDTGNWYSGNESYTFTDVSAGKHTVSIRVTNGAGLTKEASTTVTVNLNNVYVSNGGSDTTGVGSSNKPFLTLAKAYSIVNSNGNIILLSDLTTSATASFNSSGKVVTLKSNGNSVYTISKASNLTTQIILLSSTNTLTTMNVTFDGKSIDSTTAILEANGSSILNLNGGTAVKNGKSTNELSGGGINVMGNSTLNMNGATITLNSSSNQGGGVHVANGIFNLNSGIITKNSITNAREGAGVFVWNGTMVMKGGTISENTGAGAGGGVWIGANSTSSFTMSGGNVQNNSAGGSGGGIYLGDSFGTITGGTISGNTGMYGAGIASDHSTLSYKTATTSGNTATEGGGAVNCNDRSTCTFESGTIQSNKAMRGGAVHVSGSSTINLSGATISNNTATDLGGAFAVFTSSTFNITSGTISGNTAANLGGGINLDGATGVISNGTIQNNTATYGGGVEVIHSATLTIKGGNIKENTATSNSGGIDVNNSILNLQGGNITGNKSINGSIGGIGICCGGKLNRTVGNVSGNTPQDIVET